MINVEDSGPVDSSSFGSGARLLLDKSLSLTEPLSRQLLSGKVNRKGSLTNCCELGLPVMASHPGGRRNTPSRFMLRNLAKRRH